MICEPKGGWRHVEVTERRTAVDFAHQAVAGGHRPTPAEVVQAGTATTSTPTGSSLYGHLSRAKLGLKPRVSLHSTHGMLAIG